LDLLVTNLLSPIVLAFALGAVAGFIPGESLERLTAEF
jgi:hypothetical protein